jgi:hypothetical protein
LQGRISVQCPGRGFQADPDQGSLERTLTEIKTAPVFQTKKDYDRGASVELVDHAMRVRVAQRLRELGWVEGRNIAIEYRWAEGRSQHYTEIAVEYVRLGVDVIAARPQPRHRVRAGRGGANGSAVSALSCTTRTNTGHARCRREEQ